MSISHTVNGIDLLTNMGPWRRCCLTTVSLYIISWTSFRSNRYLPNSLFFTTAGHPVITALQWASLHVDAHPCTPFTPLPDDFLWVNPRSWALRIKDIRGAQLPPRRSTPVFFLTSFRVSTPPWPVSILTIHGFHVCRFARLGPESLYRKDNPNFFLFTCDTPGM